MAGITGRATVAVAVATEAVAAATEAVVVATEAVAVVTAAAEVATETAVVVTITTAAVATVAAAAMEAALLGTDVWCTNQKGTHHDHYHGRPDPIYLMILPLFLPNPRGVDGNVGEGLSRRRHRRQCR